MSLTKIKSLVPGEDYFVHALMKDHTLLHVGGAVDNLIIVRDLNNLIKIVNILRESNERYYLLGNGTNVIFSDLGFPGTVIMNKTDRINFNLQKSQVIVDSGVSLNNLILKAASKNLGGIEFLFNSKQSVGGAIYKNFEYFGKKIDDYVKKITILSPNGKILTYPGKWLSERDGNKLSKVGDKNIILTVAIQLRNIKQEDVIKQVSAVQKEYKNIFVKYPVSGRIFSDIVDKDLRKILKQNKCQKLKIEGAMLNPNDLNRIINRNNVSAKGIRKLIELIRQNVAQKTGIVLQESIEFYGDW